VALIHKIFLDINENFPLTSVQFVLPPLHALVTDLSSMGVFITNNDSLFVEYEAILTFPELLCN